MWSFRNNRLLEPIDVTVVNLVGALNRYQGRQELYIHQAPQVLESLRKIAIVESTEASNRIEAAMKNIQFFAQSILRISLCSCPNRHSQR